MVMGHSGVPFRNFIYMFHMAIFFLASGFLLNIKHAENFKNLCKYIIKKIKKMWVPYFLFNASFTLLNNVFLITNIYTDNKNFMHWSNKGIYEQSLGEYKNIHSIIKDLINIALLRSGTQMGGALWFMSTLLIVLVMFMSIQFCIGLVIKKRTVKTLLQFFLSIVFSCIGYYWNISGQLHLGWFGRACTCFGLIFIGYYLRERDIWNIVAKKVPSILIIFICLNILAIGNVRGCIEIVDNDITNPIFFMLMSITGWFFLYGIADLLYRIKAVKFNRILQLLAIHSVPIIGLHFLSFKIVNWIGVSIYGMKLYMIAAFPILMIGGFWWIAYTVTGLGIPVLAQFCFEKLRITITKVNNVRLFTSRRK